MLNRFALPGDDAAGVEAATGWDLDERPVLRLVSLFLLLAVSLLMVAVRVVYVQTSLGAEFESPAEVTTETREPLPSRDGRILTNDGQVLAHDIELFRVLIHYRWLEQPADEWWLRQQALSHLDRSSRRKTDRVREEMDKVRAKQAELWDRLTVLAGPDAPQLIDRRRAIQRRVERILQSALETREQRAEAMREADSARSGEAGDSQHATNSRRKEIQNSTRGEALVAMSWWGAAWQKVVHALTTPPPRESDEPFVVKEQLAYHPLLQDVALEVAAEIEAHPELYPGLRIERSTRRVYPLSRTAPHLVGYRLPMDAEVLEQRKREYPQGDPLDYRLGDRWGMAGIEKFYERQLRGLRGERKVITNRRGEIVRTEVVRHARPGDDVVVTLDMSLQQTAEQLLDDVLSRDHVDEVTKKPLPRPRGGCVVAIDVRTGAVLTAAAGPRFDINVVTQHDTQGWEELLEDPRKPLFSRVTEMTLPPGSVFKTLSSIAFLESGRIEPERTFPCQGFLDSPEQHRCLIFKQFGVGHGDVSLIDALARSCNVYFFAGARRTGAGPLVEWAQRLGFGQPTGIDLPGERGGNLPLVQESRTRGGSARLMGETLGLVIGQGRLTVTPLQVARMMAAVANGGKLVTPHVVERIGNPQRVPRENEADMIQLVSAEEFDLLASNTPPVPIPELSPRTLEWVKLGLQQVVAHPQGTGYKTVRLQEVAIAGKTGTAEPGGGQPDHAWFAGYVPAHQPKIAFVVVLEHAGSGGHAAGPVARKFVQALVQQGHLGSGQH